MAQFTIELSEADVANVTWLANKRGITASAVISQALSTETLIEQTRGAGDHVLVGKGSSFKKLVLNR